MCVQLSPLCLHSLLRLQVALARVPFDLPLVYFTARAVSVRLISFRFCADRFCVCSLLLLVRGTLDVRPVVSAVFALFVAFALARVPFDLPLVRVRCSLHQLSVLRGSVSSGSDLLESCGIARSAQDSRIFYTWIQHMLCMSGIPTNTFRHS